jgi:hypothetical protein
MWKLLNRRIDLSFFVNPFYLYCIAFSLAIFVYLWGWSNLYPKLSASLMLFFAVSFLLFIFSGYIFNKKYFVVLNFHISDSVLNDVIFFLIIFLGIINVLYMRYLPILDRSRDYLTFGMPVVDPVFNTLSIFFSIFFFQSFLGTRRKKFLIYVLTILIFQILIFRRSTIVWILLSSSFMYLIYTKQVRLIIITAALVLFPLFSFGFGLYGNWRSNISKSKALNDLGASTIFIKSGISYNHYMTYLYITSPLANLQKNVNESYGFLNRGDLKNFFFYCINPVSLTLRLEKPLKLSPPDCPLIIPALIVGSYFMISFFTMGWPGMIFLLLFLFCFIVLCLFIIKRWNTFTTSTFAILSATVSLLIFSNFLNRLDIILMLFIYPVLFHFIYTSGTRVVCSSFRFLNSDMNNKTKSNKGL